MSLDRTYEPGTDGEAPGRPAARRTTLLDRASAWGMPVVLLALAGWASIAYPGFLDPGNLRNILAQNAPVGIIAVAMTLTMVGGGFDLSAGAVFGCGGVVFAAAYQHTSPVPALACVAVVGVVLGGVNGLLVTRARVNPFIATLGTGSIYGGAALIASHSSPVVVDDPGFTRLGQGSLFGVPYAIWILAAVTAVLGLALAHTVYGHRLYAVGGNHEASRLAGLRVDAVRTSTYVIGGAAAALGGAILASRLGVGQGDVGANIPLEAIAMVVIGGTSLFGGEGSVLRTCTGIGILAVLGNVADSNGWGAEVENVVQGCIVIAAVALDAFVRSRRA
ncbi:ABC transporter permease [Spirillospora sp. NPDC046719]